MLRIYLFKVTQKTDNKTWTKYVGKAPARLLAKVADQPGMRDVQDAQRPLDPKRLTDLAKFVSSEEGTLATSIVLASKDNRVKVYKVEDQNEDACKDLYYIDLPSTKDEIESNKDLFYVMDGQHRLFSFLEDYCILESGHNFELTFELYLNPNLNERRLIFKNTNEKQKAVDPNLLNYIKSTLGMLDNTQSRYFKIVGILNENYPLRGRIILSAERIPGGLKAQQITKMFKKINLIDTLHTFSSNVDTDEKIASVLCTYLSGWEEAVGTTFAAHDTQYGPFSKISGLRYMFGLLSTFLQNASKLSKRFTKEFVVDQIQLLYNNENMSITPNEFFNKDSEYNRNSDVNYFASENTTKDLVNLHKSILEACANNSTFDIFG